MIDKGIGFNRNIRLEWLDAVASYAAQSDDLNEIRERTTAVVALDRSGSEATRKSVDILINIWVKSQELAPELRQQALSLFQSTHTPSDRLWLHYGLTMLYYDFFRQCVSAIGQISRYEETITTRAVIRRMVAELGHLGSLERAAQRVVASLRDWEILVDSGKQHQYRPRLQALTASSDQVEAWLLRCALTAQPVEEMPLADLLHLPALFPFRFTLTANELRRLEGFEVQRLGLGMEMVRVGDP